MLIQENQVPITVSRSDFQRISALLETTNSALADKLDEELSRANVIPDAEIPEDIVTMGSRVRYLDLETQKESEIDLVYPKDVDPDANRVSILAPVGTALLGLKVGQSISWSMPRGTTRRLRVVSVKQEQRSQAS